MPTMTDEDRALDARINEAHRKAVETRAEFERVRDEVRAQAAKDGEIPREGFDKADELGKVSDAAAENLKHLRAVRDGAWHGDGLNGNGNGPTDGPAGFTVGDTMLERIRAQAGSVALRSRDYQAMKASGAFTRSGFKSVEGTLIPREAMVRTDDGEDVNPSREALFEAIRRGDLGDISPQRMATLVTGAGNVGAGILVQPDRQPGMFPLRTRPLRLVDLITVGRTDSDEVSWPMYNGFTNAAAETAEATATTGTSGTKPESALDFTEASTTVRTVAHWIPATKRALADAGQLRTYIEQILRLGLDLRLDTQLATGNGTGENLRGIYNTVGIGNVIRRDPGTTGNALVGTAVPENRLDVLHRAITAVRLAFFEPTAIGIHPQDLEAVRLLRATGGTANTATTAGTAGTGDYIMGEPLAGDGGITIWGLRPVVSAAFTQGLPVVGQWDQMVMWLREGTQVLASDSHMDFFIRNMVAILAEFRAAAGVLAPAAFCTATL